MNCLLDRLSTCNERDTLWIADSVGEINAHRLMMALGNVSSTFWQSKRIAIGTLPILEFVATLIFLDGLAQTILLMPDEDDIQTRQDRLAKAEIDVVLEGEGLGFLTLLSRPVSDNELSNDQKLTSNQRHVVNQTTWLLPTSGTTGIPKLIAHTFASLTRSMTARRVGDYVWGSLYSLRRFAGLQVFLQSWMCATPLILNEEGSDLNDILNHFIDLQCNALSATPSMWRKLAMHPLFGKLALKQVTLGGEIIDQPILDMLSKKFPIARITHIYASTEAGVGFAVNDGLAGFPTEYLSHSPLGVEMRIDESNHLWFYTNTSGASATDTNSEWVDSGDVVEIQANRVRFLGRANGSINVGGNKVMPEEIEAIIKELSEVAFVQVRARKSAMLGSLVEAAVTPMPNTVFDSVFKKKITDHCRARLDGFKVPAFIVAAEAINLTASGKLSRRNE